MPFPVLQPFSEVAVVLLFRSGFPDTHVKDFRLSIENKRTGYIQKHRPMLKYDHSQKMD